MYQSVSSFKHLFHFSSDFSIYKVDFSLFHLFFEFLIIVYFPMLWMLVTVNKVKHVALHGPHASQITSSKILVTQTLFRVSNEVGSILVLRLLGNNSSKELLAVRPKLWVERKEAFCATHKLYKDSNNNIFKVFETYW